MIELDAFDAFILDMDGTLIDSGKFHARAFADAVLDQSGYALTSTEHHEFFASHSVPFAGVLNERHGLDLDPQRVLVQKRARMDEIFKVELFEGAAEFLDRWHGKKPLALSTNSSEDFTRSTLKSAGIEDLFNCISTADEVERRKPYPDLVLCTLQKLDISADRVVVFEDQLIGIEAAQAAGTEVIAINNGQPVQFPADIPCYTWKELVA